MHVTAMDLVFESDPALPRPALSAQSSVADELSDGQSDLGRVRKWAEMVQPGQHRHVCVGQHAGQNLDVLTEQRSGLAAVEHQHGGGDLGPLSGSEGPSPHGGQFVGEEERRFPLGLREAGLAKPIPDRVPVAVAPDAA